MTKKSIALHLLLTLFVAALVLAAGVYCHFKGIATRAQLGLHCRCWPSDAALQPKASGLVP